MLSPKHHPEVLHPVACGSASSSPRGRCGRSSFRGATRYIVDEFLQPLELGDPLFQRQTPQRGYRHISIQPAAYVRGPKAETPVALFHLNTMAESL